MVNLGLKLFSINENYIQESLKLYKKGYYQFIELYVVPNSFEGCIDFCRKLTMPVIIHAPHFRHGVNLADKNNLENNMKFSREALKFADELNAQFVIFHPGVAGNIEETVNQLNIINDSRILIENKPYYTVLGDGNICNGYSPEEISFVLKNTGVGFCLDFGHCFCAANALEIEPFSYLQKFLELNPQMFHLVDNDFSNTIDKHLHLGEGNFDIKKILDYLPESAKITLETTKNSKENLDDFVKDVDFIRKLGF